MQSQENALKNGEPTVGTSFTTVLQHTGHFWSRISQQRTLWKYAASQILSWPDSSWFLPVPLTEIRTEGTALLWCYWHY